MHSGSHWRRTVYEDSNLAQSEGQSLPEEFSTDDPQIDDGFIEDQQPFDDTVADPTDVEAV